MLYLICQIWLCLLIAALLGLVLGWWLRGRRCEAEIIDILRRQREALRLRDNRIDALREQAAEGGSEPGQPAAKAKSGTRRPAPGKANGDNKPAVLLDTPPARPDDLKQISGVGPKLEQQLNSLGVYQFAQIARFTKKDIAWVDQHLERFKGRIERDGWVAQAKRLAKDT